VTQGVAPHKREPLTARQIRLVRSAGLASVIVALSLVVIKVYAWMLTGSVALLSSLADSVLDLLASSMTLFAVRFAFEPADREHRFGHGKLEAVAGLAQALIIVGSAAYVIGQAVARLIAPTAVTAPLVGTAVMMISLVLTVVLVLFQRFVVGQTGSIAIGADELHYRADVLTGFAVLVAIGASSLLGWHRADPLLGLVVAIVILGSVRTIVLRSLDILLDRELPAASRAEILKIAKAHADVLGVHDLRTRTSGTHEFIQFHLELDPELSLSRTHSITDEVEWAVMERFPRAEVIIHADPYGLVEPQDDF
jgi:ferrous-iron efflux pump FieF